MRATRYYNACDVSCDVIYYVIAVRARRMVRIFFLPYLGNRSKSDPCSYGLFCLESHILSFPKVLQIAPESPCSWRKLRFSQRCWKLEAFWDVRMRRTDKLTWIFRRVADYCLCFQGQAVQA